MQPPDKVVLEHAGALGDFLLSWPLFLSLARHFNGLPVYQAVRPSHARWLAPLTAPCPPVLRRALDARFEPGPWPVALADTLVVRAGLAARPPLPEHERFWFFHGVAPGRDVPPAALHREALEARGIPFATDYAATFRAHFGGHVPKGNTALLFPGAGHQDKAWPLARLQYLAAVLRNHGVKPVFVLGPVERERGLAPAQEAVVCPESLEELARIIRAARFVVGPDCGPMHLAGLHGVPGVVLFGPTSPRQWGPHGLEIVTAGLPCAPCVAVTSGDFAPACPRPLPCMAGIDVETVVTALGLS